MHLVHFTIPYALIGYPSIRNHITFIIHNFGALGVAQRIQVMGFLQDNKSFIFSSWILAIK